MVLVTVTIIDIQSLKLENVDKNSTIFCLVQRAENFISKETTQLPYSPKMIKINQTFKFTIQNPLIDSLLIGVFQNTPENQYIPVSNMKVKMISLQQSLSGKIDQHFPLYTIDNKINGKIHLLMFQNSNEDESAPLLLGGINSRIFIDFDEDDKANRKPAQFNPVDQRNTLLQFKSRQNYQPAQRSGKTAYNPRVSNGDTISNLLNDQKNKAANALLKKMKLDPVRLQTMSNYIVVLKRNEELLNNAKKSGKIIEGLKLNNELDFTLISQIESSIRETEELIKKVRTLPVDDLRVKAQQLQIQRPPSSQSGGSRPPSSLSNNSRPPSQNSNYSRPSSRNSNGSKP